MDLKCVEDDEETDIDDDTIKLKVRNREPMSRIGYCMKASGLLDSLLPCPLLDKTEQA